MLGARYYINSEQTNREAVIEHAEQYCLHEDGKSAIVDHEEYVYPISNHAYSLTIIENVLLKNGSLISAAMCTLSLNSFEPVAGVRMYQE